MNGAVSKTVEPLWGSEGSNPSLSAGNGRNRKVSAVFCWYVTSESRLAITDFKSTSSSERTKPRNREVKPGRDGVREELISVAGPLHSTQLLYDEDVWIDHTQDRAELIGAIDVVTAEVEEVVRADPE